MFKALGIGGKEQRKLFEAFDRMDSDGGRSIDFAEFASFFRIKKSKFARRCFLMLDRSSRGEMTFPEFCVCAWNYCTYDAKGLATFAFRLYDSQALGYITNERMFTLVEESYDVHNAARAKDFGADVVKNSAEYQIKLAKKQIAKASGSDEKMQLGEFLRFSRSHPNLLANAYRIQNKLQQEICGIPFWERLTKKRRKLSQVGEQHVDFQDVDEIIEALINVLPASVKLGSTSSKKKGSTQGAQAEGGSKSPYSVDESDIKAFDRKMSKEFHDGRVVRLKRKKSAENIQKMMRSKIARRKVEELKKVRKQRRHSLKRKSSAENIQRMMRGKMARKRVKDMKARKRARRAS